jgi:hypothetical protein
MSKYLVITFVCLFLILLWKVYHFAFKRRVYVIPEEVDLLAEDVMANVDAGECGEDEEDHFFVPEGNRGKFLAKIVLLAKAEFGLLKRLESNRLMVRKYLRDLMRERGMRPSHIAQQLDVGVALFFVPSETDVLAHQIGATKEVTMRSFMVSTMWESFYGYFGPQKVFSTA